MKYIENPNFPKGKVTVSAVSSEADDVISTLESNKVIVVPIEQQDRLPVGIASHADLSLIHLGENCVMKVRCSKFSGEILNMLGFNIMTTEKEIGNDYPNDCIINAEIIGKNVIINPYIADKKLLELIEEKNLNIIAVKQGYAKCSCLAVTNDAIITADEGISKILQSQSDIEVLNIKEGGIYLKGYDTGLIGGCGGMVEEKILGTSGDIKTLYDYNNIKDFLRNRNIYCENLGGKTLKDIGGILPLCEE